LNKIRRFLENNTNTRSTLSEQQELLNQLPASLRGEVIKCTQGHIIKKIKFFENKDSDFLWEFLPLLRQMKVYAKDILYSQGDTAEEVFFIMKGKVKIYVDIGEGKPT